MTITEKNVGLKHRMAVTVQECGLESLRHSVIVISYSLSSGEGDIEIPDILRQCENPVSSAISTD